MRKEWRKFLQFILTVFLILVVFGFGTRIVNAEENREAAQSSEEDAEEDTGRFSRKWRMLFSRNSILMRLKTVFAECFRERRYPSVKWYLN